MTGRDLADEFPLEEGDGGLSVVNLTDRLYHMRVGAELAHLAAVGIKSEGLDPRSEAAAALDEATYVVARAIADLHAEVMEVCRTGQADRPVKAAA